MIIKGMYVHLADLLGDEDGLAHVELLLPHMQQCEQGVTSTQTETQAQLQLE